MKSTGSRVLVPADAQVERALREASADSGARVTTLRAFVRDAAEELAGERGVATREASKLATGAAIDALAEANRIRAPSDATARTRFISAADRAIGTLRAAGANADVLFDAGTRRGEMLSMVMSTVDASLAHAKLWDERGLGAVVASRLARGAELASIDEGAFEVQGFVELDGDARTMLEAIHSAARRHGGNGVRIELPRFVGVQDEDDPIAIVADTLERRWAGLEEAPEIVWREVPALGARSVVVARDAEGEARAAAAAIAKALEEGSAPERIAILVPDLDDARLEPIRAALADARIRFREPRGRLASATAEGRVTNALLALAVGPVLRDDVLEVLRAPSIHPGAWMDRGDEAEAAKRAAALAHRLRAVPVSVDRTGRWLVEGLGRAVDDKPEERWMPHALAKLVDTARFLANATTRRSIAERLVGILETVRLGKPSRERLASALGGKRGEESGAALEALGNATRAAQAIGTSLAAWRDGAIALGIADASIEIGRAEAEIGALLKMASTAPPGAAAGAGAVRIVRAKDLTRSEGSLDLLIVTGLEEGAFDQDEDDGLIDERLRRALGVPIRPPPRAERSAARRAELRWALAAATRLVFTHATGTDVEPAAPHRLIREAVAEGAPSRREPLARVATSASIADARGAELASLAAGAVPAREVLARADVERQRSAFFMNPSAEAGRFTGCFATSGVERAHLTACLGGDSAATPIAVTAIEAIAECPFRGIARRVLRVRRREELGEAASAAERGTLVHRALHAAFEATQNAAPGDDEAIMTLARVAAERALLAGATLAPLRAEAIARAIDEALAVVETTLTSGDPLRFAYGERAFGAKHGEPWQPLELAGDPPVFVEGQIDRIDLATDRRRARVIDYKTGSKKPVLDEHGKTRFQLAIYATVVEERLGISAVEAGYVIVRPRGVVEDHPKKAEARASLVDKRGEALAAARSATIAAWAGGGAPRPENGASCARCEARDVCRRPAVVPDADGPAAR